MTRAEFKLAIRQIAYLARHFDLMVASILHEWAANVRRTHGQPDPAADERRATVNRKLDEGMPR